MRMEEHFKSDIIAYLNMLQSIGTIRNFDSAEDIQVYAGEAIDSVVVDLTIQPVDSTEKLYDDRNGRIMRGGKYYVLTCR